MPHALNDEPARVHDWWRAANYLTIGQIYLLGNPMLQEPLRPQHIKPPFLGHGGAGTHGAGRSAGRNRGFSPPPRPRPAAAA
jgi:phosphoketolase